MSAALANLALAAAAALLLAALVVETVRARRRARTCLIAVEAWTTAYAVGVSKNAGAGVVLNALRGLPLSPEVRAFLADAGNRLTREAARRAKKRDRKSSLKITPVPAVPAAVAAEEKS